MLQILANIIKVRELIENKGHAYVKINYPDLKKMNTFFTKISMYETSASLTFHADDLFHFSSTNSQHRRKNYTSKW